MDDQSEQAPNVSRPGTRVIRTKTKGYFTGAVNAGLKEVDGGDVLILNQDTHFTGTGWLNFINEHRKQYGILGEQAGTHPAWPNRYIHGTFMYIRHDVLKAVGLMDDKNFPHWGSTADYQVRACRRRFRTLPVEQIPDFVHLRKGAYGKATEQVLSRDRRGLLIRTPPLVSVIITCYNYGRFLEDAINSLIGGKTSLGFTDGQTFQGFEIIIVDDGSKDNSVEIARKLADPWKGIHFIAQPNQGSAAAMNNGIVASHARSGHFIAPLDADDMMKPQRLERMLRTYEANEHSVIYDNLQYFSYGQEGVVTNWETGKTYQVLDLGNYNFEEIVQKNTMHKGLFYPKKAWEEVGGYPVIMNRGREDWAFNVGCGAKGWCGINTHHAEYLYRREQQNRTLKNTTPAHRKQFLAQLRSIYPDIYRGERPMGCCSGRGAKSKPVGSLSVASKKLDLPGVEGMATLEYLGNNKGDETWRGPVTSTVYVLGGVRKKGYVDVRDVEGMLAWRENNRPIFALVKAKKVAPAPKVEIEPVVETIEPVLTKQYVAPTDSTPTVTTEINPNEKSVSALKELLPGLSTNSLSEIYRLEQEGKNRTSALKAIEDELNARLV